VQTRALDSQRYFSHLETESNSQVLGEGGRRRKPDRNDRASAIRGRVSLRGETEREEIATPGLYVSNYPCVRHIIRAR